MPPKFNFAKPSNKERDETSEASTAIVVPVALSEHISDEADRQKMKSLFDAKDKADRGELRTLFAKYPQAACAVADLAHHTETLVLSFWKQNALLEGLSFECERLRAGLGYQDAPMLEKLLIDRVVIAWLTLQKAEWKRIIASRESHTLEVGTYHNRAVASAQAAFLSACRTLAVVQRLQGPQAVQLNIAEKQVNQMNVVGRDQHV